MRPDIDFGADSGFGAFFGGGGASGSSGFFSTEK